MNSKLLGIYLNDHLAASMAGMGLAKRCRASNRRTPLGDYLSKLVVELRDEQQVIRDSLGKLRIPTNRAKQGALWVAERVGRLKLNGQLTGYSPLSRVIELEGLVAGINAKLCMWNSLKGLGDQNLVPQDKLDSLIKQAGRQARKVEDFRRTASAEAFNASR